MSVCFRFKVAFDIDGVPLAGPEPEAEAAEGGGIDLCCFCGELWADGGAFCGVPTGGIGCALDGALAGGGYSVTAGFAVRPLSVGKL